MTATPASLTSIPIELQFRILAYLGPYDLISLRKTCQSLSRVTRERVLWISLLRDACQRNAVFEPSFMYHKMTLAQLEYAATSPDRLLRNVSSSSSEDDQLNTRKPVLLPVCNAMSLGHRPSHDIVHASLHSTAGIHLVLGGRYLVVAGYTWLAVWDLQLCTPRKNQEAIDSMPLAIVPVDFNRLLLVHATPDQQGLQILLTFYREHEYVMAIYEIYPQRQDSRLSKIATTTVNNNTEGTSIYSMAGNCVYFLRGVILNIWDFVADRWLSILVGRQHQQIIVTDALIAVLYRDRIDIWPIFEEAHFTQQFAVTSGLPTSHPPNLSVVFPASVDPEHVGRCEGICDWYSGRPQRLLFDYVYHRAQEPPKRDLRRFELLVNRNFSHGEIVEHIPRDPRPVWSEPSLLCEDHLFRYWAEDNDIRLQTSHLPFGHVEQHQTSSEATRKDRSESTSSLIVDEMLRDLDVAYMCNFCPFSGRLAYMCGGSRIRIFDFVSPPPSEEEVVSPIMPSDAQQIRMMDVQMTRLPLNSNNMAGRVGTDVEAEVEANTQNIQ